MSIIGNIGGQSGGGSLTKSILIVTAPTGSTVTITKGSVTKTATEKNGEWWFKNLENGEWTIRAELDGQSATEVFNITQFGVYRKPISYRMTPEFTYTGDYEVVQDDDTPIADFATWKGNWKIRFLTSGTLTITNLHGFNGLIDLFLVGGGGGGSCKDYGSADGRSGGGGGYAKTIKKTTISINTSYPINIGSGGSGGYQNGSVGKNGGATSAFGNTANGGNGGANYAGGAGGSGGGTGEWQGHLSAGKGGSDGANGGGGNGAPGGKGQGSTTREFGEQSGKLYAGGGGGANHAGPSGAGGAGGGGNGNGSGGGTNTGGGGGGKASDSATTGYPGGSGIVIIRNAREVAQ